jgi:hypothetical protein
MDDSSNFGRLGNSVTLRENVAQYRFVFDLVFLSGDIVAAVV